MARLVADWKHEDFFSLDEANEVAVKKILAGIMKVKYMAMDTATEGLGNRTHYAKGQPGIQPYDPEVVKQLTDSPDESPHIACTISACMVTWKPSASKNNGYIRNTCAKYLKSWDMTQVRKAGGIDPKVDMGAQHLTLSNMSSLTALLVELVYQLRTQQDPKK